MPLLWAQSVIGLASVLSAVVEFDPSRAPALSEVVQKLDHALQLDALQNKPHLMDTIASRLNTARLMLANSDLKLLLLVLPFRADVEATRGSPRCGACCENIVFFMTNRLRTALRNALVTQFRVIGALILRDTRTRFGRSQLGYLWAIAEPLSYVAFMAALFAALSRHPPFGNDTALFFASGILPFTVFATLSRSVSGAIEANRALLTYPIVKPVDTLVARGVLEFATSIIVMIVMFGGITILHGVDGPVHLDTVAVAIWVSRSSVSGSA